MVTTKKTGMLVSFDLDAEDAPPEPLPTETIYFVSRGVAFLRHWPIERLREDPRSCTVYYFDRNQVLVRDSNNSDWIYIVLKGSLSVIKKLKRVEPQLALCARRKQRRDLSREPKSKKTAGKDYQWQKSVSSTSLDFHPGHHSGVSSLTLSSPDVFKSPFELESKLEQTLPGYRSEKDRLGCLNYDKIIDNFRSRLVYKDPFLNGQGSDQHVPFSDDDNTSSVSTESSSNNNIGSSIHSHPSRATRQPTGSLFFPDISVNNKTTGKSLTPVQDLRSDRDAGDHASTGNGNTGNTPRGCEDRENAENAVSNGGHSGDVKDGDIHQKRKRFVRKNSKGVYLAPSKPPPQQQGKKDKTPNTNGDTTIDETAVTPTIATTKSSGLSTIPYRVLLQMDKEGSSAQGETIEEKLAKLQIQYQRRVIDREGRKTIAEELDYKARRDYKLTEADLDPTVIEVQVLERGQYFGLTPILFPDQSSLSVISNGAECLVMSKKLFLRWASEKCLRHLRQTESPFPSEQELSRKLQEMVDWQANRAIVYQNLTKQIMERKAKRKQFFSSIHGEYCFRTGPT